VEPTEGTRRALAALREEGTRVEVDLRSMATSAREIVPDLVGLSVADLEGGLSFTLVATDARIAALDAMQYLDGGPCVAGVHAERLVDVSIDDLLDERRWHIFARATAAAGIANTLTLPIVEDRRVVGSVNLYASSPDAFGGHHDDLATALGASALGAVSNADLGFATRLESLRSAETLEEREIVDIALGIVATRHQVDMATAEERLRDAAARSGVPIVAAARALRDAFEDEA
jgi:GAF domain-containing protein